MDTHYKVITQADFVDPEFINPDTDKYSETLKASNIRSLVLANKSVIGSREDCLDIVRMGNVWIKDCKFYTFNPYKKTRTAITLKGGCESVKISNCFFEKDFESCHIDLGGHTIYWPLNPFRFKECKAQLMKEVILGPFNTVEDGKPIKVKAYWVKNIVTTGLTKYKIRKYPLPLVWLGMSLITWKNFLLSKLHELYKQR